MRKCRECSKTKPLVEFKKHSRNKTGYDTICKPCHREFDRKWQQTPYGKALMMFRSLRHRLKKMDQTLKVSKSEWLELIQPMLETGFSVEVKRTNPNKDWVISNLEAVSLDKKIVFNPLKFQPLTKHIESVSLLSENKKLKIKEVGKRHKKQLAKLHNKKVNMAEGFVYCVTHPDWPGLAKIGMAINPETRLSGYQTYHPYKGFVLEEAFYFKQRHLAEKMVHSDLKDHHVNNEWFEVDLKAAYALIQDVQNKLSQQEVNSCADHVEKADQVKAALASSKKVKSVSGV